MIAFIVSISSITTTTIISTIITIIIIIIRFLRTCHWNCISGGGEEVATLEAGDCFGEARSTTSRSFKYEDEASVWRNGCFHDLPEDTTEGALTAPVVQVQIVVIGAVALPLNGRIDAASWW